MKSFERAVEDYANLLAQFIADNKLPYVWFNVPDHLAIKCASGQEYEDEIEGWRSKTTQGMISQITMDGRRLGTAELKTAIKVGNLGEVTWLEIMQPRPEKEGKDYVGLEHMEFCYPDFAEVTRHVEAHGVDYKMEENSGHAWVNIVLNKSGQELKINNRTLADVVPQEIKDGVAAWV